ncbi:hypothetical protein AB0383_05695 [Amycolatopsis sp. NPDC051373]|uniref:hypothetical protein n=1 Tax=Amycolatopsis sp. NPDC051373 TaxID=3155801 RepID=UPI00344F5B89
MRGGHRISLLLVLVFIGLYVGFQRSPRPYQVPVAVAGTQLQTQLAGAAGPAVAVVPVADQAAGEALLSHGDAVATLADQAGHLRLDVAGASGATTVSAAEKLVSAFAQHRGQPLVITDVLPLSAFDSKGMSGFYVAFGVTLASFALAQNLIAAARRVRLRHRMAALAGFAVLSGIVAATLAGPVLGALPAPFAPLALTLGLLSAATALATKALGTWFGAIGIPMSTLLLLTVGNSTSGGVLGVNLLPEPARCVSAVLPPGAAVRALSDLDYFHGRPPACAGPHAAGVVRGCRLPEPRARTRPRHSRGSGTGRAGRGDLGSRQPRGGPRRDGPTGRRHGAIGHRRPRPVPPDRPGPR